MSNQIVWTDKYKIGITKVDNQHHKLFELLENLRLSLPRGLQNPLVGLTLKELVNYTQTHFRDEEQIMQQIKFDDIERHINLHKKLLEEIAEILRNLKDNENYNALDLVTFLKHWIIDHMIQEDVKIGIAYKKAVSSVTSD